MKIIIMNMIIIIIIKQIIVIIIMVKKKVLKKKIQMWLMTMMIYFLILKNHHPLTTKKNNIQSSRSKEKEKEKKGSGNQKKQKKYFVHTSSLKSNQRISFVPITVTIAQNETTIFLFCRCANPSGLRCQFLSPTKCVLTVANKVPKFPEGATVYGIDELQAPTAREICLPLEVDVKSKQIDFDAVSGIVTISVRKK